MARDKGQGALRAEIDIGLVNHHRRIGMHGQQPLDRLQPQPDPGGRIGIGQDYGSGCAAIVLDIDPHRAIQRHGFIGNVEQPAIGGIETVGDVGKQQRAVMPEQSGKGMGQHLVRTIADEHMIARHPMIGRQGIAERARLRIGIKLQPGARGRLDGRADGGRGAKGQFIGVEFDQALNTGLLARNIGRQAVDQGTPELAHAISTLRQGGGPCMGWAGRGQHRGSGIWH